MKRKNVMLTAFMLAGMMAMAAPAVQQPPLTPEQQKHMKLDEQKQKDLDKLRKDEEDKAQKSKTKAAADCKAEIEKRTNAANEALHKKETAIDHKKNENIAKGRAAIEKKYEGKHAKVTPVQ